MRRRDGVQQFSGSITDVDLDDVIIYLNDLQAGDTIYAIAKGRYTRPGRLKPNCPFCRLCKRLWRRRWRILYTDVCSLWFLWFR